MLEISLLTIAIGACLAMFVTTLVQDEKAEFARIRAVGALLNRFGGTPIGAPISVAFIALLIDERWWMLLTLNIACYGAIAPFMTTAPLRLYTAICVLNAVVLTALGMTR